jgi:hypothetical protein
VRVPVRLIHVVRNPFDVVARMLTRAQKESTVASTTKYVARLARANARLIDAGRQPVLTVRQEEIVADPRGTLRRACELLGVEPTAEYLDACASIVFDAPRRSRELIEWSEADRAAVEALIESRSFFSGYSFEG